MLKNYFIVALRNFWRNKIFSLINVVGLSIGISAALVIYLIVQYDFSFDKFHKDGDRIYRIVSETTFSGESFKNSGVPIPMGRAVDNEVTGLDMAAFFITADNETKVSVPDKKNSRPTVFKNQKNIVFADENYFKLFQYKWVAGSPKTSLQQPYQVVLTETNAKLYFPLLTAAEIIGKEIYFNDTVQATVTGVVKDLEQITDFNFRTFISKATFETPRLKSDDLNEWGNISSSWQLFVKLSGGTTPGQIHDRLEKLFKKYKKVDSKDHSTTVFALQPLNNLHFNTDYDNFDQRIAHKPTLYGLLAVSAFLLLLGCINFINLTTSQASQRAKEIGIRKTMGSSRRQLIFQFLSETFFITILATLLSIAITPLLLNVFADFIPPGLHFNLLRQPQLVIFLLLLIIIVSVLSGFYPALVLSRYNPAIVLKNQSFQNTGKTRSALLRKTLTVSQFIIAQIFIMATLIVSKQIHYTLNKDLGFKKEAIVYLNTNYRDTVAGNRRIIMDKLKALPGIATVSLSTAPPSSGNTWSSTMKYKDGKKEIENDVQVKMADTNYIRLYKLKLLAGRNLPYSDTINNLIINETYAHILGFKEPEQAIGKYIDWNKQIPIVGVVADFHQKSLHERIKPLVIGSRYSQERTINIALQPQNKEGTAWKTTIAGIEKVWKEFYPEDDFECNFFDESLAKFYKSEQDISHLLKWATGLTILISCLGLLGLVIYTTNQRSKEIGVRKVLGASVSQIVSILSKDFMALVVIAFVVATPVAWWAAYKWLENFAYKTTVSWWIFLVSGALMTIIALLTLSIQTIRAASANPVKSLRTE